MYSKIYIKYVQYLYNSDIFIMYSVTNKYKIHF